jgi:hypothetical protein
MTETVHRVMLSIPGYSPDMVMGSYYTKASALELAGKIARGEIVLYIESQSKTVMTDVFYSPKGDTD